MREELMKFALFYLGVIMIAASIISGLVTYYYPVSVEVEVVRGEVVLIIPKLNRTAEPRFIEWGPPKNDSLIMPKVDELNAELQEELQYPRREILIDRKTTYPLRDYALLTYLFSGTGLALIVVDRFKRNKSEVE